MGILEIVLLAAGAVIFIVSFCIPVKQEKLKEETKNLAAREVRDLVSEELENVRGRLSELSEEEMQEQIEKSKRSMERISNEKIMAVNEYSDTVLDEIHKNHEEVVFLYDMLKGKRESLSESYGKMEKNIQELLQQVKDAEITVRENLSELEKQSKESAGAGSAPAAAPGRKKKPDAERKNDGIGGQASALAAETGGKVSAETTVFTEPAGQREEADAPVFSPFMPEKVEVVPKKKPAVKKAVRETAPEAADVPAQITAEQKPPVKNAAKNEPGAGKEVSPLMNTDEKFQNADTVPERPENSNERILELHRAGKSNMAIARELGLGVGEVKLVIDLYEGL